LLLHLSNNRVLLVIDNLETVIDQTIRHFVRQIPNGSKIVFTSRVGLKAFDFPVDLKPFSPKEAHFYLRRACRVWGLNEIAKFPDQKIEDYCRRLQYNPLFMKWFVQGVRSGQRADAILANPKIILQFCLENVFNHLDEDAKKVAHTLLTIGGFHTQPTLSFITQFSHQRLQQALASLLSANVVVSRRADRADGEDAYSLTPLVLLYLGNYDPPSSVIQNEIVKRHNTLRSMKDEYASSDRQNVYNLAHIAIRDEADYVAARILQRALDFLRRKDFSGAEALVFEALELSPNYFEAKRVEALVAVEQRNYVKADACYQAAISLAPNHAPLRSWYAGFLARCLLDQERAIYELQAALKLDPGSASIRIELARLYLFSRQFEVAEKELANVGDLAILANKLRSKYFDLVMQVPLRQADQRCGNQDFAGALECARRARDSFSQPGFPERDPIIRSHIVKFMSRCLPDLRRGARDQPDLAEIKSLEAWVTSLSPSSGSHPKIGEDAPLTITEGVDKGHGPLISSSVNRNFAFIKQRNSNLFFHRSEWMSDIDFLDLPEGTIVEFEEGQNSQGLCAVNVRVATTVVHHKASGLNIESEVEYISGEIQTLHETFGFISTSSGQSYFFHRNNLRHGIHFDGLSTGCCVKFKLGSNHRGVCADDVH
jgi:tetratricopeptide (TPR) repeat protein/cold shock CspA family protein